MRQAANGYRVFDESAVDELAFISRAKGIGMSLEDIAVLPADRRGIPSVAGNFADFRADPCGRAPGMP